MEKKKYIINFFIVLGLFILSQISMTIFGIIQGVYYQIGQKVPLFMDILLIGIFLGNIYLLYFLAHKLNFFTIQSGLFTKKNVIYIILGAIALRIIAVGLTLILRKTTGEGTSNDQTIGMLYNNVNPIISVLSIGISAPIMEEIVFRGGIIGFWLKKFPVAAMIVSSILFGLIHGPTNLISFIIYAGMGVVLGFSYYKTQRLEVSIAIHLLNNILPALMYAMHFI